MQCPYCNKELVPFRVNIKGQKATLIGWLCKCTDKIRDKIFGDKDVSNSKS